MELLEKNDNFLILIEKYISSIQCIHQPKYMSGHSLENDPYFFKRSVILLHYVMWLQNRSTFLKIQAIKTWVF